MDCPSCGHANAAERVECEACQALLVDVFDSGDDSKTDPIQILGGTEISEDTAALLRAAREIPDEDAYPPRESLQRLPSQFAYTGDLPRLYRFGGRYQILEKLGEGGMGRVYKALDLELDRAVALKTIRAEKGTGVEILERFKQELILARKITHKNVIRIYDLGESDGMKFFTMELVDGKSLRDVLKEKEKLSVKKTLSVMTQILSGLGEAHEQGVVHRDLKPQNIMVDESETIRIMDFGIARTADSATMTGTGEMMGTPDYISPEQVKGETANAQSDLYSCGVILYELLTGETPFKGDTPISKIVARIQAKPKPPREVNPDIPTYLERIVLKCLEVDPELRYKKAEEIRQDLEREQVDRSLWIRTKKTLSRRRGWVAAAGLAVSLMIGNRYYRQLPDPMAAADVPVTTIAVLPFHNMTGAEDLEWMENGIPELLITDISQSRSLRPVMAERMNRILGDLGKSDQSRFDDETIEVIGQMAHADHVLYGGFARSEEELRLNLVLRDTETGIPTPINLSADGSKVFALVDGLTDQVATTLNLDEENLPIGQISTPSLAAFRAYHRGMAELRNGANQAAIPFLETAIGIDGNFAMAHARLAEANLNLEQREEAKESSRIATKLALEEELPLSERYQIYAIAARSENDLQRAVVAYRKLSDLYPNDPEALLGLAGALDNLGERQEAATVYRRVLTLAPNYGAALLGLGRNLVLSGKNEEAIPLLEDALASGQFGTQLESLSMIYAILGSANRSVHNYDAAIAHYKQSLEFRRRARDYRGVTAGLTSLAKAYKEVNRLDEATDALEEALAVARERQMPSMESYALLNLGNLALEVGDLDSAFSRYRHSLDIEWDLGEHREIAYRLDAIAEVYRLGGRYTEALVYLAEAKRHLETTDVPDEQAYNLSVRGHVKKARGRYDEAIQDFLTALPVLASSVYARDTASAQLALSDIYCQQGRFREALAVIEQANERPLTENRAVLASTKIQFARVLLGVGDSSAALEPLDEAAALVSDGASFEHQGFLHLVRGQWLRSNKEYDRAEAALGQALDDAQKRGRKELAARATLERGWLRLDQDRPGEARAIFDEAYAEADKNRHRAIQAEASLGLAQALWNLGQTEGARDAAKNARDLASTFGGTPIVASSEFLLGACATRLGTDTASSHESQARETVLEMVAAVPASYRDAFMALEPWASILDRGRDPVLKRSDE